MIAILGGLGAAAAWAVSTLCSSRSSRMISPQSVAGWVMLIGLLITIPPAAVDGVPGALHGSVLVWFALAGAGNVAGLLLSYHALRIGQVGLIAPLVSTEGAIAAVISVFAGESLPASVGVTLAVIALGICVASIPSTEMSDAGRAKHPSAVILAGLAALSFGAGLYATGRAGARLPSSWVVLSARLVGVLVLTVPLAIRGRLELVRPAAILVLASGVCEVLGFYSYTLGSRHGLAVAAVLSSQFAVLTLLGSYLLFHERLRRLQLVGVGCVLVGVAALSVLRA